MKRLVLLTLMITLVGLTVSAAADEIYVPSKLPGTSGNVFPFRASYGDWRYQLVFPAAPLGKTAFTITDIGFNPTAGGGLLCSLMEVRMSHTTVKPSAVFATNLPNPTTVLASTNYGWATTANTWSMMGLANTFNWDGISGLCIEIRYQGGANKGKFTGVCNYTSPSPHFRIGKSGTGAFNATSGTNWGKSALAIRIDVVRASITPSGTGKIGTTLTFNLLAAGEASKPYQVGTSLGQGPIALGTMSLPLSADTMLLLSTGGLAPTVFQAYGGKLDTAGKGAAKLAIPNIAALKGVRFYTAFLTLDPTKPLGVSLVSPKNVLITIS